VAACSIWIRNFAAIAEQRPAETAARLNVCIVQTLATHISNAEIIRKNENNIWLLLLVPV
jgi:hypothetical protein